MKSSLTETLSTEDIKKVLHIQLFQQLQIDTAKVLNAVAQSINTPKIQARTDILKRLEVQYSQLNEFYLNEVVLRNELHERPYADETVSRANELCNKLKVLVVRMQPTSRKVSDTTTNLQFEQSCTKLFGTVNSTIQAFKKAKLEPVRSTPKTENVQLLTQSLLELQPILKDLVKSDAIMSKPEIFGLFNKELDIVNHSIKAFNDMKDSPTTEFYSHAHKSQKYLMKLLPFLNLIPQYTTNQDYKKIVASNLETMKIALEPEPASIQMVKVTYNDLLPILKRTISALEAFEQNPTIQADKFANFSIHDWHEDSIATLNSIESHINSTDYNPRMAYEDKITMQNLISKISQIPPQIRSCLKPNDVQDYIVLLGELAKAANVTINCIRQLGGLTKPICDSAKFSKIDVDDEIDTTISSIADQINDLRQYFSNVKTSQSLHDRPNAQKLIEDIDSQLSLIGESSLNNDVPDDEKAELLQQLIEKMPEIINSTDLLI